MIVLAVALTIGSPGLGQGTTGLTLALDDASLKSVAAELTRQSGVPHRAVGKEADAQRVAVFCKDQTPEAIRQALADCLGWEWAPAKVGGRFGYTFIKGVRLRKLEVLLREQEIQAYLDALRATIEKAQHRGAPARSGSGLDLQATDPQTAGLLRAMGKLPPDALPALVAGRKLSGATGRWPEPFVAEIDTWSRETIQTSEEGHLRSGDVITLSAPRDPVGRPLCIQVARSRGKLDMGWVRLALSQWVRDETGPRLSPDGAASTDLMVKNRG